MLELLADAAGDHFLILLRQELSLKFKGVYALDLDSGQASRIYGDGPASLDKSMVDKYFKYDSAGKQFLEVLSQQ